jgi:hypothetical protein
MKTISLDWLTRLSLYGETLREGAILLAIFGPIASLEIFKSLPTKLALVVWSIAAVLLYIGVEFEVHVSKKRRKLDSASASNSHELSLE